MGKQRNDLHCRRNNKKRRNDIVPVSGYCLHRGNLDPCPPFRHTLKTDLNFQAGRVAGHTCVISLALSHRDSYYYDL